MCTLGDFQVEVGSLGAEDDAGPVDLDLLSYQAGRLVHDVEVTDDAGVVVEDVQLAGTFLVDAVGADGSAGGVELECHFTADAAAPPEMKRLLVPMGTKYRRRHGGVHCPGISSAEEYAPAHFRETTDAQAACAPVVSRETTTARRCSTPHSPLHTGPAPPIRGSGHCAPGRSRVGSRSCCDRTCPVRSPPAGRCCPPSPRDRR